MLSLRQNEEITIIRPGFKKSKPGGWYAQILVIFDDGTNIKYGIGHNISYKANGSASTSQGIQAIKNIFRKVRVTFSDGKERIE